MDVTSVILCGGQGTRLGRVPKGLLQVGGRTLIERLIDELPPGPAWISANRAELYEFVDLPVVGDVVPGKGAPGGVFTALCVARTDWVLVVACDMPRLSRELFHRLLLARSAQLDAVCFERAGDVEPLCALYHRRLVPRFERELPSNPSLRGLLRSVRMLVLPEEPRALDSLNTPQDLPRHGASLPAWARSPLDHKLGVSPPLLLR